MSIEKGEPRDLVDLTLARSGGFELKVNFEFPEKGITVIFGESGSGKTTVLRCVAGLERGIGSVKVGGDYWQNEQQNIFLPTWQRPLGYVFQEASLFPHLTALSNIEFAVKRTNSSNARERMETAIDLLGIRHLLQRRPAQLSGGERQRVAIARAVATEPRIMLFDEPLAALDFARKAEILPWLEKLRNELNIPMLYVTHSAEEVMRLADNLVVLQKGSLLAAGNIQDVLANVKVPISIGGDTGVLLKGKITEKYPQWHLLRFETESVSLILPDKGELSVGDSIRIRILAKEVSLTTSEMKDSSIQNSLKARVVDIVPENNAYDSLVQVNSNGQLIIAKLTNKAASELNIRPGSEVWVHFKSSAIVLT